VCHVFAFLSIPESKGKKIRGKKKELAKKQKNPRIFPLKRTKRFAQQENECAICLAAE
jgi:hypothetical protein